MTLCHVIIVSDVRVVSELTLLDRFFVMNQSELIRKPDTHIASYRSGVRFSKAP